MKKKIIKYSIGVVVLAAVLGGYAVYAAKPVSYQAAETGRGDIAETIELTGKTEGDLEQEFYARVTAPVRTLAAKEGVIVSEGQLLLEYDTDDMEEIYLQSDLSYQAMQNAYEAQIAKSTKQQQKYEQAKQLKEERSTEYQAAREGQRSVVTSRYQEGYELSREQQEVQQKISDVTAEIAKKESELTTLKADCSEIQLWIANHQGAIAGISVQLSALTPGTESYEKAAGELSDKEDDLDESEEKLKEKTNKMTDVAEDVSDLQAELAKLQAQLPGMLGSQLTPEENDTNLVYGQYIEDLLRSYQEAVTNEVSAENAILNEPEKNQLKKNTEIEKSRAESVSEDLQTAKEGITAPYQGVVTKVYIKENAYVTEGTPLFSIASTDSCIVPVMVSRYDIGKVKEGQQALITMGDKEYEGHVDSIYRVAETDSQDKTKVKVDIRVDQADEEIILGMEADVTIYTQKKIDILLAPREGIYEDDGGSYCYVIQENKIAKKYVKAGLKNDDFVEILEGLTEKEAILTDACTDELIGEKAYAAID